MKMIIIFSMLAFSLSSCKKMALRHNCTCELKRTINGLEETTGIVSDQQLGTYNTASDSCKAMQERYTYTTNRNGYTEAFSATCEIE